MDLNEIVEEAKTKSGLSQNKLAARIGLDKSTLSQVLHGRRPLPAEAAIELFDLTGIHPREILRAAVKTAACFLAGVVLYTTGEENAQANQRLAVMQRDGLQIIALRKMREWLRGAADALKDALGSLARWGILTPT